MKTPVQKKKTPPGRKPVPAGKAPAEPCKASRAPRPPEKPAAAIPAPSADVLKEIREVRALLSRLIEPPRSGQAALESSVDSLRRLLSETLESRMEAVVNSLAAVRALAARGDAQTVPAIDRLLGDLGAIRFEAARLDYVDPLIHRVAGERADAGAPDGVIIETVQPGFRTGRGAVVAKAAVIVNRRD
jgi:hypothetical protein